MILEHLVNLEEKELDSLLESLEETLDKLIDDTLQLLESEKAHGFNRVDESDSFKL